jgi:hypothetical protein
VLHGVPMTDRDGPGLQPGPTVAARSGTAGPAARPGSRRRPRGPADQRLPVRPRPPAARRRWPGRRPPPGVEQRLGGALTDDQVPIGRRGVDGGHPAPRLVHGQAIQARGDHQVAGVLVPALRTLLGTQPLSMMDLFACAVVSVHERPAECDDSRRLRVRSVEAAVRQRAVMTRPDNQITAVPRPVGTGQAEVGDPAEPQVVDGAQDPRWRTRQSRAVSPADDGVTRQVGPRCSPSAGVGQSPAKLQSDN